MSIASPEWDMLLSAAQKNWAERIREMILTDGVNPSHSNAVGQTALHIAALWGNIEAVNVLVELGANVKAQNNLTGASPLHMVAQSHKATIDDRLKVVEILLNAGAICEQTDKYGFTPSDVLEKSIEGSELDDKTKLLLSKLQPSQPVIHQSIIDRDLTLVEALLSDKSRNVNETYQNATPLSLAVRIFLEDVATSGNETNLRNAPEVTLSMIKMLLKRGADPNCLFVEVPTVGMEDIAKEPALHKLVCTLREIYRTRQHEELTEHKISMLHSVIDLLVTSGSNVPLDTIYLLHQAARLNECLFATFLLDQLHVDPNTKGRQGMTPLHFAARSGKVEMLHLLLNREGIDASVTDDQGKTAIHYAKVNAKDEAVHLLESLT